MHTLKTQKRTEFGKGPNHRLRAQGLVPINIIGSGKAESASLVEKEITQLIESGIRKSTIIELDLEGKKEKVFVKEIQRFPDTGRIRHIDFYKLIPGKKVQVTVGVVTTGVAKGSKLGGQFTHLIHEIKVKTPAEEIIDVISVDVTNLDVGESVKVSQLPVPKSWEIVVNGDPIVTSVNKTKALIAAEREEKKEAAKGKPAAKKAAAKAPAAKK